MTRATYRLALAAIVSLLLHIFPFIGEFIHAPPPPPATPPLRAEIRPSAKPLPAPPALQLDKPEPPVPSTPTKNILNSKRSLPNWQQAIRQQLRKQRENGVFYPEEAIAQGLEGEVLVFMLLDENGRVAAARIEQGSGHSVLDEAAVKAVRALHSLPADAPRQAVLPVLFRLH